MTFTQRTQHKIEQLKQAGTYKRLRHLEGAMDAHSPMREAGGEVLVMSSNNYLGLSNHPKVVQAAISATQKYGAGTASVRFICGTMGIHQALETALAKLHKTEASLTYSSCWSANGGLFNTLVEPGDVVLSDALNHASIIDGIRLVKKGVTKAVYRHSDLAHLAELLEEHKNAGQIFIVTDGVFSMEGDIANLPELVALKNKYKAVLIVDDSHGVGVLGKTGAGVSEHFGCMEAVDITVGTLGKALGGAAGGYVAGPQAVIELLIQQSRSHIFSNAISPATAGAALAAVDVMLAEPERVQGVQQKAAWFREALKQHGLTPLDGESAIVPLIVGDTALAIRMSDELLKKGIFVTGFGFPVVPEGEGRIRIQISAAHTQQDLQRALDAIVSVAQQFASAA